MRIERRGPREGEISKKPGAGKGLGSRAQENFKTVGTGSPSDSRMVYNKVVVVTLESVADFIRRNKPNAYCDDCLKKLLKLARRQEAQQATRPLGLTGAFARNRGYCFNCGGDKQVIRAN